MKLNRIQVLIFKKLSKESEMEADSYIKEYSMEFIGIERESLQDLSEEEGDMWINRAYILSLSDPGDNDPL